VGSKHRKAYRRSGEARKEYSDTNIKKKLCQELCTALVENWLLKRKELKVIICT
jgi:hypothetical protein